ncbi:hypothetical protein KIW84_053565 [Lathyrus oleraceus]|uniref:Uncharacterized protein n=1 Tax=Pisum sativum TaxID=3888 RepID=A0A9D5AIY6_PEA|nr:hypothetical protein KIW84_053565 [Pisum sativum]
MGPKNCIALEPYTTWVRKRASEYLMPYDYSRPTPLVVAGPSTLPNQGVEELRDEDFSRAWIREREELLQQLKEKDALIEFLEHQVIDDPDDTWTSLLPQSSEFWKRRCLFRSSCLWPNSVLFIYFEDKLTHRYYTRANSSRLMDHLEQENRELKDEVSRLTALMEQFLAAQNQPSPPPTTPP